MRVFFATLRKLVRRPATWVTLLLTIALLALIFVALGATSRQLAEEPGGDQALLVVTFPGAYTAVLAFILGLGGLLGVIYGAAIAGSEWTWGTLKAAVARGEGRSWYVVMTFAAVAALLALGLLITYVAGVLLALLGAALAGIPTDGIDDIETIRTLPEQLVRGWVALSEQAALGFAIATIARSQLAGIGVGIGAYFAENFATIFRFEAIKYLPFNAAGAVVGPAPGSGSGQGFPLLDANTALVVVLVYLVAALVVAGLFTERAEIGG